MPTNVAFNNLAGTLFFRTTARQVWIGYDDRLTTWDDGTLFSWNNWNPGEGGINGEDCAVMNGPVGWKWFDWNCNRLTYGLCQFTQTGTQQTSK